MCATHTHGATVSGEMLLILGSCSELHYCQQASVVTRFRNRGAGICVCVWGGGQQLTSLIIASLIQMQLKLLKASSKEPSSSRSFFPSPSSCTCMPLLPPT
jgi:hypothetical protein